MRKTLRLTAAAMAGALLLAGCGSDDEAGSSSENASGGGDSGSSSPAELTFVIASAVTSPKEEVAVVAVGQEMGYFEEENLTVDTVNADGSVAAVQAVAGGNGDITPADAGSILAGIQGNVPVKAVGGLVQNWPWQIATQPGSDDHLRRGPRGQEARRHLARLGQRPLRPRLRPRRRPGAATPTSSCCPSASARRPRPPSPAARSTRWPSTARPTPSSRTPAPSSRTSTTPTCSTASAR